MIRYSFIYHQVLQIYRSMDKIAFPIEPCDMMSKIENCRVMTYQEFAAMNGCTVSSVIQFCQSKSGCTHYEMENDRYLILWNEDGGGFNVPGRRRWTKAHELGHVVLRHFPMSAEAMLAEHSFNNLSAPECESEADHFAATLLCPMPLFETLKIQSPVDIMYVFGLSTEAANYRWNEYVRWTRNHRKTAWENDIRNVIQQRKRDGKFWCSPLRAANCEWSHGGLSIWMDPDESV